MMPQQLPAWVRSPFFSRTSSKPVIHVLGPLLLQKRRNAARTQTQNLYARRQPSEPLTLLGCHPCVARSAAVEPNQALPSVYPRASVGSWSSSLKMRCFGVCLSTSYLHLARWCPLPYSCLKGPLEIAAPISAGPPPSSPAGCCPGGIISYQVNALRLLRQSSK
jgi:hypothetical protein